MKTLINEQKKTLIDLVYADGENAVIHDLSEKDLAVIQGILGEEKVGEVHVFKEAEEKSVKMAHSNCILNVEEKIFGIKRDKDWEKEEYAGYTDYINL